MFNFFPRTGTSYVCTIFTRSVCTQYKYTPIIKQGLITKCQYIMMSLRNINETKKYNLLLWSQRFYVNIKHSNTHILELQQIFNRNTNLYFFTWIISDMTGIKNMLHIEWKKWNIWFGWTCVHFHVFHIHFEYTFMTLRMTNESVLKLQV